MRPDLAAIAVLFALVPAAAAGGGLALPVLVCLAGAALFRPTQVLQLFENKAISTLALLAFGMWAVIATAWSPEPTHSKAWKLAVMAPLGLLFVTAAGQTEKTRRLTAAAGLAAFMTLAALLVIETSLGLPLNRLANPDAPLSEVMRNGNRGTTILLAMTWGVAGALLAGAWRGKWIAAIAALAIGGAIAPQFDQLANLLAFAAGCLAFALGWLTPRVGVWASSAVLAVWLLAAPFATPALTGLLPDLGEAPIGWAERIEIWRYTCARIMESPLLGYGLDASNVVTDQIMVRGEATSAIPLHPHSSSLQIWYELGLVGALLGAAVLVLGARALAKAYASNRPAAAATSASLVSLGVLANLSFSAWHEWWIAALLLAAALVRAISAPLQRVPLRGA